MNKNEFLENLSRQTGYSKEDCFKINEILEDNFFISKNNKDKIVFELEEKLSIDKEKANMIYNKVKEIINNEIKNKLKHPFKNLN